MRRPPPSPQGTGVPRNPCLQYRLHSPFSQCGRTYFHSERMTLQPPPTVYFHLYKFTIQQPRAQQTRFPTRWRALFQQSTRARYGEFVLFVRKLQRSMHFERVDKLGKRHSCTVHMTKGNQVGGGQWGRSPPLSLTAEWPRARGRLSTAHSVHNLATANRASCLRTRGGGLSSTSRQCAACTGSCTTRRGKHVAHQCGAKCILFLLRGIDLLLGDLSDF